MNIKYAPSDQLKVFLLWTATKGQWFYKKHYKIAIQRINCEQKSLKWSEPAWVGMYIPHDFQPIDFFVERLDGKNLMALFYN